VRTTVRVRHVTHATPRTRIIALDFSDTEFPFAAGQAVMVGLHASPLSKPYSIASAPWESRKTGVVQLLAQIDDTGSPDPHLELAEPGTLLDVDGPFGSFGLPVEFDAVPLLFVAGGTGIAPLRSMLMDRLARPRVANIAVVFSARSADGFAYRTELEAMAAAGRIKIWFTVTRPDEQWPGRRGRIDAALLREALSSLETCCMVCGPPALVTGVTELLVQVGVAPDRVLTERY
jgi:CDP-4-dehydro-6-deoxyglucose reductase